MLKYFLLSLSLFLVPLSGAMSQNVIQVTDASIAPGQDVVWTSNNIYVLNGFVFVESGSTLTIEAGTVVKGKSGQGANASALIIARGGKIYAEGTSNKPIIFTAELDDVNDQSDLTKDDRGLWGGVIILGNATINVAGGSENIEGIPVDEPRGVYGGNNDDDNSGVFRYVSIRHGGTNIGSNNEINGLTMGAVGRGTTIEYVEVYANEDDGYEWFGGTVNTRYLIAAYCGDDSFDYDEGFRGKGQFWFAIQDADVAGSGGEHDGGTTPEDGTPYAIPVVYNATYIGSGATSTNTSNDYALNIRDNAGGKYYNSIFTDFAGVGVQIEDLASGQDSRTRMEAGDLDLSNNLWFGFGNVNGVSTLGQGNVFRQQFVVDALGTAGKNNLVQNPQLASIARNTSGQLDPRPAVTSPAWTMPRKDIPADGFYVQAPYVGAFGNENWTAGWTYIYAAGYITSDVIRPSSSQGVIQVTDASIAPGQDVVWTSNNVYVLNGFVFVESGSTLTIEAGTVVKGKSGQGANASALIVARGGKIYAEGTPNNPIIFTAELDDVNDPSDLTKDDRGIWGGVIILGNATINVAGGSENIEGIPVDEPRGIYGGNDDDDDSGVFRYVSIRHGGTNIGSNNEINGLTMGAVGRGTTIEYVEVFANEDDGFEWFGGTVNTRYLIAAYCGDDSFDYDEGFRGKGQFWFAIQDADVAGSGGEHDGGTTPEDGTPYAIPVVFNATYIGSGATSTNTSNDYALNIRDNAGGKYYNSIFTDFAGVGVQIEDLASGQDSRTRMEAGDLDLSNNLWFGFGNVNGVSTVGQGNVFRQQFVVDALGTAGKNNLVQNPQLASIARNNSSQLDPRPAVTSPAWTMPRKDIPVDGFYRYNRHVGAFGDELWTKGWTFLSKAGYISTNIEDDNNSIPLSFTLEQNYPNPFNPSTVISFNLPVASDVQLTVYDMLGRRVATLVNEKMQAGSQTFQFNASNLASGIYLYELKAGTTRLTQKMTLIK